MQLLGMKHDETNVVIEGLNILRGKSFDFSVSISGDLCTPFLLHFSDTKR